jgi:hypothetical protein
MSMIQGLGIGAVMSLALSGAVFIDKSPEQALAQLRWMTINDLG